MKQSRRLRTLVLVLGTWALLAYLVAPWLWERYFRDRAAVADAPRITTTSDGHPGDPLNIALVGSEAAVALALHAAGWFPANPITFATSIRIVVDAVLRRPDDDAPVSDLYLFGRKQDLAFEKPAGEGPRQRHHVRFWRSPKNEAGGPMWLGAATFDASVGLSHTTGEVTHHIGPDVDAERDLIANDLAKADWAASTRNVPGFHSQHEGRNGGGDAWRTDGGLVIVVLGAAKEMR
jgi:hypothetical protein